MRRLLAATGLVLAAGFLTGCSEDSSDTPDDASTSDFCDALIGVSTAAASGDQDEYDDAIDELNDTGTPEGIDGDAREGFEIIVDKAGDVDLADVESFEDIESDLSDDERDKVEAFGTSAAEVCAEEFGGDPATDVPTE